MRFHVITGMTLGEIFPYSTQTVLDAESWAVLGVLRVSGLPCPVSLPASAYYHVSIEVSRRRPVGSLLGMRGELRCIL